MIFFHPGGNFKGSSDGIMGFNLATLGNVVVVTINYRLGILGFLVLEGLIQENPKLNYGLQDQQFALAWLQDNIAAFGGDPTKVTIFGESAGGDDVLTHMLMPESWPLFRNAISESPAVTMMSSLGEGVLTGLETADRVGCANLGLAQTVSCMRAKSVGDLGIYDFNTKTAGPVVDHVQIMNSPPILWKNGMFNKKAVLIVGSTEYEGNLLNWLVHGNPPMNRTTYLQNQQENWGSIRKAPWVVQEYSEVVEAQGYWQALSNSMGDGWIACNAAQAANNSWANQGQVYRYLWTQPPHSVWIPQWLNATHSVELPYVFHVSGLPFTPAQNTLSLQTIGYWASLAHCDNPNGCSSFPGQTRPKWPQYNAAAQNTMIVLSTSITFATDFERETCQAWNENVFYKFQY